MNDELSIYTHRCQGDKSRNCVILLEAHGNTLVVADDKKGLTAKKHPGLATVEDEIFRVGTRLQTLRQFRTPLVGTVQELLSDTGIPSWAVCLQLPKTGLDSPTTNLLLVHLSDQAINIIGYKDRLLAVTVAGELIDWFAGGIIDWRSYENIDMTPVD